MEILKHEKMLVTVLTKNCICDIQDVCPQINLLLKTRKKIYQKTTNL